MSASSNGDFAGHTAKALFDCGPYVGLGVHDGLSALLAERSGCDFLWASSFGASATRGIPDAGLLESSTMVAIVEQIARATRLPIVVDMDAGYGDELKVRYAADLMARAGASAICIEDNPIGKRCSLYDGQERVLVPVDEHCARLRAARAGVVGRPCAIVARTEALVAGMGLEEALERAGAYVAAGADAVFAQAVAAEGLDDLLAFCTRWERRTPVFLAPTCYPACPTERLHATGASHLIFANQGIRAAHRAMLDVFRQMLASGVAGDVEGSISSVGDVTETVAEIGGLLIGEER